MKRENAWKAVSLEGGELYEVSEHGEVRRIKSKRPLKGMLTHKGYHQVYLYENGCCKAYYTHQLVSHEFLGKCPEGMEVNHLDGIKTNNHYSNLEYVTHGDNMRHAYAMGLRMITLNAAKVIEIRSRYPGETQQALADEFGVSLPHISRIVNHLQWKHVA